jgi:hypothetical protein
MSTNPKQIDAIFFRCSTANKYGMLAAITRAIQDAEVSIFNANASEQANQGVVEIISEDLTSERGFDSLLRVCRSLQSIEGCNHLFAQFVRCMHALVPVTLLSGEKGEMHSVQSVIHSGTTPFESYFSGQLLNEKEPLHPANISASDFEPVIYELDKAAASFISNPDRLFKVHPSDLEKIIAEVYRAHGLDVRVTGGPKDHGVDAKATAYVPMKLPRKFSQYLRIAIQVKRYKQSRKVRESELRNLYGSLLAEGYDRGVLVTTSSLTAAASHYLETRYAVKDRITVIAGDEVLELLLSYCKQKWVPFWR